MYKFCLIFLLVFLTNWIETCSTIYLNNQLIKDDEKCDKPLFLTPLIKAGKFDEAKIKSKVIGLLNAPKVESYSGYLTVNEKLNSNMFFWFFPSKDQKNPIALWLQGGPGASSMFGLFVENGPYALIDEYTAILRKYSWLDSMSLLYLDNPVGTGFSFTESVQGYATNQNDVAKNLYNSLQQFFTLFSEYQNNDFYITGESYAGKYILAIGFLLHTKRNKSKINFKGVAIGNGFIDPESMMDHSSYFYEIGLFDKKQEKIGKLYEQKMVNDIHNKKFIECISKRDEYISHPQSFFVNSTGITFHYNFLLTKEPTDYSYFLKYLDKPKNRKAIHVGNKTFNSNQIVMKYLQSDRCKSVKPWLEILMENYKVLLYSGQLDIIDPSPLTDNMIKSCKWRGAESYSKSIRKIWKLDGQVAGYLKKYKEFYFMIIRNGGHMLPYDKPKESFYMITQFIKNTL